MSISSLQFIAMKALYNKDKNKLMETVGKMHGYLDDDYEALQGMLMYYKFIGKFVLRKEGIIFGGYVRDFLIRKEIPNDIDVLFSSSSYYSFKRDISAYLSNFDTDETLFVSTFEVIRNISDGDNLKEVKYFSCGDFYFTHKKLILEFTHNGIPFSIKLDCTVYEQDPEDFTEINFYLKYVSSKMDFDVNQLYVYQTLDNIKVKPFSETCSDNQELKKQIIRNILAKRLNIVCSESIGDCIHFESAHGKIVTLRKEVMIFRGWTIMNSHCKTHLWCLLSSPFSKEEHKHDILHLQFLYFRSLNEVKNNFDCTEENFINEKDLRNEKIKRKRINLKKEKLTRGKRRLIILQRKLKKFTRM